MIRVILIPQCQLTVAVLDRIEQSNNRPVKYLIEIDHHCYLVGQDTLDTLDRLSERCIDRVHR